MSPQWPVLKAREVVEALKRGGWQVHTQAGSHCQLKHDHFRSKVTVPIHTGDLPRTTLRRVLEQAGLTLNQFLELL